MKAIKVLVVALVFTFGIQVANAQVRVGIGINIGAPVRYVERPYYNEERVVYYNRPVCRDEERPVYYHEDDEERPVYYRERHYERPVYREVHYGHYSRGNGRWHEHGRGRW
jgi:DNA-binding GntR family transcriptional regulator